MTLKELAQAILAQPETTQNQPAVVVFALATSNETHAVTAFAGGKIVAAE